MQASEGKSYVAHQMYRMAVQHEYAMRTRSAQRRSERSQKPNQNKSLALLSVYLERHPISFSSGKINVIEKGIEEIDILPSQYRGIHTLFLSNNKIADLAGLAQFHRLRTLSLAYNDIVDISQLEYLSVLSDLRTLRLDGNGICRQNDYRLRVIAAAADSLASLDGQDITDAERVSASQFRLNDAVAESAVAAPQKDPVTKLAQRFSPKSLREKLRAAQSEQDKGPDSSKSSTRLSTQVNDPPISSASLVRDLTVFVGEQPSTILRSLNETDRDDKDVFDRHTESNQLSVEFLPGTANLRTFSELAEIESISTSPHRAAHSALLSSLQTKQGRTPLAQLGPQFGSALSTRSMLNKSDQLKNASNNIVTQHEKELTEGFPPSSRQSEHITELDNTAIVAARTGTRLSAGQSLITQSLCPDSYSLASPQELQRIVAEQAKELSILRAKYMDYGVNSHSLSFDEKRRSPPDIERRKQTARLEHFNDIFNKIIKRSALYTLKRNCMAQARLREVEKRVVADQTHFILSKYADIVYKVARDCFKGQILMTTMLVHWRKRHIFIKWKEHVLVTRVRQSQYVVQRDMRQAIKYHETNVLKRIAFMSLYTESDRRAIERSLRYAQWVELHGLSKSDYISKEGIFTLWRQRLDALQQAGRSLQLMTETRLISHVFTTWIRTWWQAQRIKMMESARAYSLLRAIFSVLVTKYLRIKQGRILFHSLGKRYSDILRRTAFHQWWQLSVSSRTHPLIERLSWAYYHEANKAKSAKIMRRCFWMWRYSSDVADSVRMVSITLPKNRNIVVLALESLRTALFQRAQHALDSAKNEKNEGPHAHLQTLKDKISILSKELNVNISTQHTLRDKVSQLENKCEDLLFIQQTQVDEILTRDKRISALENELEKVRGTDHMHVETECTDIALLRIELKMLTEKYDKLQTDYHAVLRQNKQFSIDIQTRDKTIEEQIEANRLLRDSLIQAQQFKADMVSKTALVEAQLLSTRAQLSALDKTAAMDREGQQIMVNESMRMTEEAKTEVQALKNDIQYYKGLDFAQRTKIRSLEMQNEELAQRETRMQEQIMDLSYSTALNTDIHIPNNASRSLAIGDFNESSMVAATVKPIISYTRSEKDPIPMIKRPSVDVSSIDLEVEELQNRIASKFF